MLVQTRLDSEQHKLSFEKHALVLNVPFVGGGYGGLTVAILAVTIAGALTAQAILPSAALATLLGTVVSYFFVQRRGGQDSGGQAAPETGAEPTRSGRAE